MERNINKCLVSLDLKKYEYLFEREALNKVGFTRGVKPSNPVQFS